MDAVRLIKEEMRMCRSGSNCKECKAAIRNNGKSIGCGEFRREHTEKFVEIVETWRKANPPKTYKDDFFEKFPDASKDNCGYPKNFVCDIYNVTCRNSLKAKCWSCWDLPLGEQQ